MLLPFSSLLDSACVRWGSQAQKALAGRTFCLLDKFGFSSTGFDAPDAGSMWFRNIWFRDAFEGVRNNLPLYLATQKRGLRGLILGALALEKDGRIPNKLAERAGGQPDYSSTDATLLCLLAGLDYLEHEGDAALSNRLRQVSSNFISSAKKSGALADNGLLLTPANHSWMDSVIPARIGESAVSAPTRIPAGWLADFRDAKSFSASRYYLAELNAYWLLLLRRLSVLGLREASALSPAAEQSYRKTFFAGGRFSGIVSSDGKRNFDEASPCIQSLALLPELFSAEEANAVLESHSDALVYRGKRLFGVLVRHSSERAYYGDAQYHGAVCWPRDSYYLFKLLHRLGDPRAEEILLSHLDHQMNEGAVFYSHELFSLAEGRNPSPTADAQKPVPVKNPAQYFSQWCQPYYDFLQQMKPAERQP
jgi:glycogen debranching enzyme